jgi:hypothetical protein
MSTLRFVSIALLASASLGCRVPERDRNPVIDETGDAEDCPGCFDVAFMSWSLQGARYEGDLHPIVTSSDLRPARLTVTLVDNAYIKAIENAEPGEVISPYDERWTCFMTYTPSIASTGSDASAMFVWELGLEPLEDGCGPLDADWVNPDLFTALPGMGVTMTGAALDSVMENQLKTAFEAVSEDDTGEAPDWETEGAPYYIGLGSSIDGQEIYGDGQSHYGRAFQVELVDGDLTVRNETSGGILLTTEQIAAGQDGWFEIYAWTFFSPYDYLR